MENEELTISSEPIDILFHLFKEFTIKELLIVSEVSVHWRNAIFDPRLWQKVKIYLRQDKITEFCTFLTRVPFIKNMQLKYSVKSPGVIFIPLTNLHVFRSTTAEEDEALNVGIGSLKQLTCLVLQIHYSITELPASLKHITIYAHTGITDDDLYTIASHSPALDTLVIRRCGNAVYTDRSTEAVLNAKKLTLIRLNLKCRNLTMQSISYVAECKNLIYLRLKECKEITKTFLIGLSQLSNLQYLHFGLLNRSSHILINTFKTAKYLSLKYFGLESREDILDDAFFDALSSAIPNVLQISLSSFTILAEPLAKFIRSHPMLVSFSVRGSGRVHIHWKFMNFLIEIKNEKANFQYCICGAAFDYLLAEQEQVMELYHKVTACNNCEFIEFPFACLCIPSEKNTLYR